MIPAAVTARANLLGNALHTAMPFLFEHIADETELLLPDNLLLSDAVVAKLTAGGDAGRVGR